MLIRGDVYDSMVRLCRRRIRDQASITASDAQVTCLAVCMVCVGGAADTCTSGVRQTLGGGTSFDVLLTVLRQQYRRHIRRTAHRHRSAGALSSYKQRWEKRGECIMDIAASVNFSSYQLARLVVEAVCGVGKAVVSRWVKDTSLIPNARLQREVQSVLMVVDSLAIDTPNPSAAGGSLHRDGHVLLSLCGPRATNSGSRV